MKYRIVSGDLASVNTDCIVCPASVCKLVQEVYRKAGEDKLRKDVNAHGEVKDGEVFATIGYDLPTGCILHVGIPVWADANRDAYRILADLYSRVLITADRLGYESIAMPVFGGCAPGYDVTAAFRLAEEALRLYKPENTLQEVYLVIRDPGAVEQLESYGLCIDSYEPCIREEIGKKADAEEIRKCMKDVLAYTESFTVKKEIATRTQEILSRVEKDFRAEDPEDVCLSECEQ